MTFKIHITAVWSRDYLIKHGSYLNNMIRRKTEIITPH